MNPLLIRRRGMMAQGGLPEFHRYLVFDGTAYIATDMVMPQNCSIRVSIGNESSRRQMRVFRVLVGNGTGVIFVNISAFTSSVRTLSYCYANNSSQTTLNSATNARVVVALTPHKVFAGSTSANNSSGGSYPLGPLCIGGFTGDTSTTYHNYNGKMTPFRIYDDTAENATSADDLLNYNPMYTLKPCLYNGEAGLWCEETHRFYGNTAGAGTLTVDD